MSTLLLLAALLLQLPTPTPETPKAEAKNNPAATGAGESSLHGPSFTDWVLMGSAFGTFVATAAYAYFSWGMWNAINRQGDLMKAQLDQMKTQGESTATTLVLMKEQTAIMGNQLREMQVQAVTATGALEQARRQAEVMERQLGQATQHFKIGNRPWVHFADEIVIMQHLSFDGQRCSVKVSFTIKNIGTSPALQVCNGLRLFITQGNINLNIIRDAMAKLLDGVQMIGGLGVTLFPEELSPHFEHSTEAFFSGSSGQVTVWLMAVVVYRDQHGDEHVTENCWQLIDPHGSAMVSLTGMVKGKFRRIGISSAR